ncbi:MAG: hypothetical protein H7296_08760 [Bacteroidia bacterium]|nr:hypothetical protein [Bacteroidia bacterium]
MKKYLSLTTYLLLITILISCRENVKKQILATAIIGTEAELAEQHIMISRLDKEYNFLASGDTMSSAFKTSLDQRNIQLANTQFFNRFEQFLNDNDFKWGQPVTCSIRIYCEKDGMIDYLSYDFKTSLANNKILKFNTLLTTFVATHKIEFTVKENYTISKEVQFNDIK